MCQPHPDERLGVDLQMPALRNHRLVILGCANHQLDGPAVQQQTLQAERPGYGFRDLQHDLDGAGEMNDRKAPAPDPGFDILGIGVARVGKYELCMT